jgi:hypothetical protein
MEVREMTEKMKKEELVEAALTAIREHPAIGRGTCSSVDETLSDDELRAALAEDYDTDTANGPLEGFDRTTVEGAVKWQLELESIFQDREACAEVEIEVNGDGGFDR